MAGGMLAYDLAERGVNVVVVDAGSRFKLADRFTQLQRHQVLGEPIWPWMIEHRDAFTDESKDDLGYSYDLNQARVKGIGGSSLHWGGLAQRLRESDFQAFNRYGMGVDWPVSYEEIEPYYCKAEWRIGVSGLQNPVDPPRSRALPMPSFPMGHADRLWLPVLDKMGISYSQTSEARNSQAFDGRSPCIAYSYCRVCPSGARYSADHHINMAELTGHCEVLTESVARRVEVNRAGTVTKVHVTKLDQSEYEIQAKQIVIACHAVESARLLLLSGLAPESDHLGRNLMEHWYLGVGGYQDQQLFPGRIGFSTLESNHFYDDKERDHRGAIKIEFGTNKHDPLIDKFDEGVWGAPLADHDCERFGTWLSVGAETEHQPNKDSRVSLDEDKLDMFGDPIPKIRFALSDVDIATHERALEIVEELLHVRGVKETAIEQWLGPGAHHMGTCRMSETPTEGVVDANCRVHGTSNLYCVGSSVFPTSGARQPTLTIAALALRLADHLVA